MPLPKDPIKAEETRRKMSEAAKKRMADPEIRRKLSVANTGKIQSTETIAKRVEKLKGIKHPARSDESRQKYSESANIRWKDPEYRKQMSDVHTGKKQSPEIIQKRVAKITGQQRSPRTKKTCTYCGKELILAEWEKNRQFCSKECKGKWQSENAVGENSMNWHGGSVTKQCEVCGKEFEIEKNRKDTARFCSFSCKGVWMSENLSGENNPSWTGGPKVYCEKWTAEFRRRIRAFFDYKCVDCGSPQNEQLLHCHHVYYDKKACCAVNENGKYLSNLGIKGYPHSFEIVGDPNKFVTLCQSCHARTTAKKKREYWARHFEEIINIDYQGNSYLTKEEYQKMK